MALPGISNANEFYSAHYLESVLTNDIKKVRERWTEEATAQLQADPTCDISTPEVLFKALRKPWQKLREAELGIANDPAERLRLQRELFFQPLMQALGYPYAPKPEPVLIGGEAYQIPLLGEVNNAKGEPWLWVVECFNPSDEPADPLELTIATGWACQIEDPSLGTVLTDAGGQGSESWEELISERIFAQDIPPRWVLAVSRDQLLLIDRQKWAASRLLRFELDTLLGENNPDAVLAAATLLHREHTCPTGGGTPLLDELDENSHKHAYEVSGDLKYALRKSIELLGNEAIHWRRSKGEGVFKGKTDADQLTLECLRYMYRLLFLFYIESRPDLGYAPMGSDVYRLGYSLESLRDMDTAELGSEEDKESTYISDSLDRLFQMIWEGYPKRDDETAQLPLADADDPFHDSFRLTPLKAHLFDPERMPTLTRVRFRNVVLREVIELMSLTKEGKGKRRGRVSYSQLGINQLGAVYEALLSFRGFFAEEDLYEVQPAPKKGKAATSDDDDEFDDGDDEGDEDNTKASGQATGQQHDELEVGHFVTTEQLKAYKAEEIVPDPGTGKPKCYPKGSFIYRLAGRDREKSASYYTPESLTQCLVKYALKELLPGKTAADILQIKVCEPAMGSAAFLNEVVNQLAQTYLELRQQETGKSIPHEQFATELQKVKMRLADQNVFGVDLNPVAVELAEVSLWLNSIFTPEKGRAFVPWFSQQLVCGNSLIGARRQIYRVSQLPTSSARSAKPRKLWHEHAPEELAWDAELPKDAIFHFLLPDPGMAAYSDKVIKELEPEAIERCKRWNKAFVGEVFTEAQIAHLLRLSQLVDSLWKDWAVQQMQLRLRTTDPLPVWEDPTEITEGDWTPLKLKDRIQEQEVLGRDVANTNARLRLKWAMDYWCALWFWPIRQAESLPSRDTWLLELSMILGDLEQGITPELGQGNLFADTQPKQLAVDFCDRHGFVDVEKLKAEFERLRHVESVAHHIRPLHWDLEFADLLARGGFDLIVGNPPWIRIEWDPARETSEVLPIFEIRIHSNQRKKQELVNLCRSDKLALDATLESYQACGGIQSLLGSKAYYRDLQGQKPNLYKGFLVRVICLASQTGILAFLTPQGYYEDPNAKELRAKLYPRLRNRFQFQNKMKLFPISDQRRFGIDILGAPSRETCFASISNLLHPRTIDDSFEITQSALECPAIKDTQGRWITSGHPSRIVRIDKERLDSLSMVYGESTDKVQSTRLPLIHSSILLASIFKICSTSQENLHVITEKKPSVSVMWDQTKAEKDGLLRKITRFPQHVEDLVISGPHYYVSNPLAKTPRRKCLNNNHYDCIDHQWASDDYLPRSNYEPVTKVKSIHKHIDQYKVVSREMLSPASERTLVSAIYPPGSQHLLTSVSTVFKDLDELVLFQASASTIVSDFIFKCTGCSHSGTNLISAIPRLSRAGSLSECIQIRTLTLNCIHPSYYHLWSNSSVRKDISYCSPILAQCPGHKEIVSLLPLIYSPGQLVALRRLLNPMVRRAMLVEADVLMALMMGLSLHELIEMYRLQFPLLRVNESSTFYDKNGRIVLTGSRALSGVGIAIKNGRASNVEGNLRIEEILEMENGSLDITISDDTLIGGPIERVIQLEAPFVSCDRVDDYRVAWEFFENKGIDA